MGKAVKLRRKSLTIEPFIKLRGSIFGKIDAYRERTDEQYEEKRFD